MNEMNKRNFLLRMSNGNYYRIFSNKNNILIIKSNNKGNWSTPFYIENKHPCFFANLDAKDNLHLLCQDNDGNVLYYRMQKDQLYKYQILKSAQSIVYDRNFYILNCYEESIFFYTIIKNDVAMLVYQTFCRDNVSIPNPIAIIPVLKIPYWIDYFDKKTAIILYPKVQGDYIQICSLKFKLDTYRIISKTIISNEDGNCQSPKFIRLEKGEIALLYTLIKNNRYHLKCQISKGHKMDFEDPITIALSNYPFSRYNLEYSGDKININWLEKGNIYFREKFNSEIEFTSAKKLKLYRGSQTAYYIYSSNTENEKDYIFSTEQPVSIEGKIYHSFYRENKNRKTIKDIESRINSLQDYSLLFNTLTDFLGKLNNSDNDANRENNSSSSEDIISLLSQVLGNKNVTKINKKKRNYKLKCLNGSKYYIAARE